jgi:hypothetical protein
MRWRCQGTHSKWPIRERRGPVGAACQRSVRLPAARREEGGFENELPDLSVANLKVQRSRVVWCRWTWRKAVLDVVEDAAREPRGCRQTRAWQASLLVKGNVGTQMPVFVVALVSGPVSGLPRVSTADDFCSVWGTAETKICSSQRLVFLRILPRRRNDGEAVGPR